jgi:hypothetical protein
MSSPLPPIRDGRRWDVDNAASNGGPATVSRESIQRLVVLGYITAVVMPPVGLILGLLLAVRLAKPNSKQGILIIAVSVIATIAWVLALVVGLLNPNSETST